MKQLNVPLFIFGLLLFLLSAATGIMLLVQNDIIWTTMRIVYVFGIVVIGLFSGICIMYMGLRSNNSDSVS